MNDRCGPVHTGRYCTGFQEGYQRWTMGAYPTPSLFCAAIAVLVLLTAIGAPSAFAQAESRASVSTEPGQFSELPHSDHPQAAYQSGFQHGVIDGNRSSNATSYIDQPKHGFAWHTSEFVKGYVNGYCSIPANKDVGTDDDRAAFYCPDGPSSAKWFIGKHEPITEGIAVATYGIPSAGVNVTYQFNDKTSGSSGSETRIVNQTGEMHFLGYTDELVGFYPGDKVTVSVSQCITQLNAYGFRECIPQSILDNKTITLGETGGIVSLDLSKSGKGLVLSAPEAPADIPRKPLPVPPSSGGTTNIQSRFGPGTEARGDIDFQMGCNCVGQACCFRGYKCDGSIGAECTTLSSANASTADRNAACTALRARFLANSGV